ncbi:hypothetical protein BH11ACT2_BH11ACT2_23790 [soil metagenome]
MAHSLETELIEILDAVAPPLIDLEQLDRLVAEDERTDAFDGECSEHDACRPIFPQRLAP